MGSGVAGGGDSTNRGEKTSTDGENRTSRPVSKYIRKAAIFGCVRKEEMPAPPLHSRDFQLDERCLTIDALMHVALVLDGN